MLWNEVSVRDNLRTREGKRVFFLPKGDQLTSGARDFLTRERIALLSGEEAKLERYRLLTGGTVEEKPEHMTHLHSDVLVRKDHPRILFRGRLDTLEAELLLCQLASEALVTPVGEILTLTRQILRCEVLQEPLRWDRVCGLTEGEQRKRSHFPQAYYGQPHFMPAVADGESILRLNRARCAAREAELAGVAAFVDRDGKTDREDILKALNRISSMLYILMVQEKSRLTG